MTPPGVEDQAVRVLPREAPEASPRRLPQGALEDPTAGKRKTHRQLSLPPYARRLIGPVAALVVWELVTAFHLVDERSLASPWAVICAAVELWRDGELQRNLSISVQRVCAGLVAGTIVGLVLAILAGVSRIGRDLIDSSINMLRMIPVVAMLPLIILWVGIGEPAKIFLIAVGTAFPIYMNSYAAICGVDPKLVDAGRAFGLRGAALIRKVILPGAVAGFLVGLRWALGAAWLLLFFAEQINADRGIGYLINQAQAWNRTDIIIMGVAIYGLLGLASDALVRLLERWLLAWRSDFEGT